MNYHRFRQRIIAPLVAVPVFLGASMAFAQDSTIDTSIIDEAKAIAAQAISSARETQTQITRLSDQADQLIADYQEVSKIVDGLRVYNAGYRRTIAEQERVIAQYEQSIAEAAELQRQIPPLMERMQNALEQFVDLDMPFLLEERRARLATIRDSFDDSNVNIAEKFRAVLTAYQIESNYGRTTDAYTDTLEINGVERDVDILQVGRIALLYQTSDQTDTGMWDKANRQWVSLGNEWTRDVRNAIRMAQELVTTDIIELPIPAPESAQ